MARYKVFDKDENKMENKAVFWLSKASWKLLEHLLLSIFPIKQAANQYKK